jgi:hypothetical protein
VASLRLKQPAHLAVAQKVSWDMLVVDEAHYLRNPDFAAQAVNALLGNSSCCSRRRRKLSTNLQSGDAAPAGPASVA